MSTRKVCILGGSGFIGRNICAILARRNIAVRVLTRRRERARHLLVFPQIEVVEGNCHLGPDLVSAFEDCDAVINLVGILNQRRNDSFRRAHTDLPLLVAQTCREQGVPRLLHMSSLGAAVDAPSQYLSSKGAGEEFVHGAEGLAVTSFRPSVVFGPGDGLFNRFAQLLRTIPLVFPLAKAEARLQPVYVRDVAAAMCNTLDQRDTFGKRYDLGGPEVMTLEGIVRYTAELLGIRRIIFPLSDGLAVWQARVLQRLPGQLLTTDNLRSLDVPSVTAHNALPELGIAPVRVETIVPGYLGDRSEPTERRQGFRRRARRD